MTTRLSGTYVTLNLPREPRVGATVLVLVVAAVVAAYFWLRPGSPAARSASVEFVFDHAQGLTPGDPVLTAGARVGQVEDVLLEQTGRVVVRLRLEERWRARPDATARIRSQNFAGDRYLEYHPGSRGEPVPDDTRLAGTGAADAMRALTELQDQAARVALRAQRLNGEPLRRELEATAAALEELAASYREAPVSRAMEGVAAARAAATGVERSLDSLRGAPALDSAAARLAAMGSATQELADAVTRAREVLGALQGKFAEGDAAAARARADSALRATAAHLRGLLASFR